MPVLPWERSPAIKINGLDRGNEAAEKQWLVLQTTSSFYARWRARRDLWPSLREEPPTPPEQLLQLIWFHQRLKRDELVTLDGQAVRILHPGFWNREAGPDFRGAVVQFDFETPRAGDVEIDLTASGWRAHKHDRNPNFKNVELHVVWDDAEPGGIPTLSLKSRLDAPLSELALWLGSDATPSFPSELRGQCCAPLRELSEERLVELLQQAAMVRLQSKAAQFQARAHQAGWEQALYEGMFRALGYKHNVWPMQRLAELRTAISNGATGPLTLQARLLGVAGLLPEELSRSQLRSDAYVRRLWDLWWRDRDSLADSALPRSVWRLYGLRPANHPQRRLALAAHWLADDALAGVIEKWATTPVKDKELGSSLLRALQVAEDDFWSWHWTLRSKRMPKPQPLLGPARITDLAVNAILPWLWTRASKGGSESLRLEIERRYLRWPTGEDNSVLRLARQRLLGRASPSILSTACAQQGLLQIVRDFCDHSNAMCQDCQFPDLVRQFGINGG
jgi:hypothetical protein